MSRSRLASLFWLLTLCSCSSGGMKCPNRFVVIDGSVNDIGSCASGRVEVRTEPQSGVHQLELTEGQGSFSIECPFDSTKSGGRFHHDCSRRPSVAVVRLICSEAVVDELRLTVPTSLPGDARGDYRTTNPVELTASKRR